LTACVLQVETFIFSCGVWWSCFKKHSTSQQLCLRYVHAHIVIYFL